MKRARGVVSVAGGWAGLFLILALVAGAAPPPTDVSRRHVRDRLLTLEDGFVLRASTRWVEDHWELRRDGSWRALPVGAVVRARLERDVLREARRRRRGAFVDGSDAQVDAARWMLAEGLYVEFLEQIDAVLAAEADHAGARAALVDPALPFGVPAWDDDAGDPDGLRDRLLDYGARSPRSLQELVVHELARAEGRDRFALRVRLEEDLEAEAPGRRELAVLGLRRVFPGEAGEALLRRALVDSAQQVRSQCALALRTGRDREEALAALVDALGSDSALVRTHAAQGLGRLGLPAAVAPLASHLAAMAPSAGGGGAPAASLFVGRQVSYVQDFDTEVAAGAAVARPRVGTLQVGAALGARVLGVRGGAVYSDADEARAVRRALGELTGARVSDGNAAWKRGWAEHGEAWLAEVASEPSVGASGER